MFHLISRHLEVGLKKLGCASLFNPLLGILISDETQRVVFDILHHGLTQTMLFYVLRFTHYEGSTAKWSSRQVRHTVILGSSYRSNTYCWICFLCRPESKLSFTFVNSQQLIASCHFVLLIMVNGLSGGQFGLRSYA